MFSSDFLPFPFIGRHHDNSARESGWTTLDCPVFDRSVCTPIIFCGDLVAFGAMEALTYGRKSLLGNVFEHVVQVRR